MRMLRTNVFPKSLKDASVTIFSLIMIPLTFWFEEFVVLPFFYQPWSLLYNFHLVLGLFLLFNIVSNFVAIIFTDTSIKGRIISTKLNSEQTFCSSCESIVPPRSWHCHTCNICILKRDHHCLFTSCCIGHYNQRYFFMFVFYIFISLAYCFVYNTLFFWEMMVFKSWLSLFKIIFPLAFFLIDVSFVQLSLFLYLILTLIGLLTGVLLYYHGSLMVKGKVNHERNDKTNKYDRGRDENIKVVLGERWHLVWISPFVESKLPCDGINWENSDSRKTM